MPTKSDQAEIVKAVGSGNSIVVNFNGEQNAEQGIFSLKEDLTSVIGEIVEYLVSQGFYQQS